MPIATLKNVSLSFGTDTIFDHVNLALEKGERLCLTGRNGSGKSTLLKVLEGEQHADEGEIWRQPGLVFTSLQQQLPTNLNQTVFEAVALAFEAIGKLLTRYELLAADPAVIDVELLARLQQQIEAKDGWHVKHRIDAVLERLQLPADVLLSSLSGGWLKRVSIAQSLVQDPDIWLLDEPTNHLDIPAIDWLENVLLQFNGTIIFVSHDRRLMRRVANSIIEVDRGRLTRWDCDYETYIERRDHEREVELQHNKRFDEKLANEETWIRQGIKARRTRNEGRVRLLEAMRAERQLRRKTGNLKIEIDAGIASGKIVKEATGISKSYDGRVVIKPLDLIVQRGDRIGIIGPNGSGKTTLVRLLLEQEMPDTGTIKSGSRLKTVYFDQVREQLNPAQSVSDYIAEGREFITVNGKEQHVVSYLGNFLFDPDQSRAPIRTLSGGEQNRLLLARLFSMPANLLVLDEPTNDLDVETLELLEAQLASFDGTILMVSHDREFMDNVTTSLLVLDGRGRVTEFIGGYSDWLEEASGFGPAATPVEKPSAATKPKQRVHKDSKKVRADRKKLERELEKLPDQIDQLEVKLQQLNEQVSAPGFYDLESAARSPVLEEITSVEMDLTHATARWEWLEAELGA